MKRILPFLASLCCLTPLLAEESEPDSRVFELRTYHANEGKLDALLTRFRDHTLSLFEKHGMTNVGYWVPVENEKNELIYLLSFPNKEAQAESWKLFRDDPDWKAAYKASIKNGKLVAKIDSLLLEKTDFSGSFEKGEGEPRLFEMRTYTAAKDMLPDLEKRFRDHTRSLFEKHGMTNLGYFELLPGQKAADRTLLYFLAHTNAESAKKSWKAFRNDPEWRKVAEESVKNARGPILAEKIELNMSEADTDGDGNVSAAEFEAHAKVGKKAVNSVFLQPTDFSPIQ